MPARVLGAPDVGRLEVGRPADLVVLDDELEIERVSSAAKRVSSPEAAACRGAGSASSPRSASSRAALRRLLEHEREYRGGVAPRPANSGATIVRIVGHGSSDNAASYGVYAFGLLPRWTALRDSITLTVYYDTPST